MLAGNHTDMIDEIRILGNKINCITGYDALYSIVSNDIREKEGSGYVTVNNVHTMMEGFWDASYQEIINSGYLSIPDGKPLQIIGRLKGNTKITRLFGPTVMENFIDWGRKDNLSHFFFGSSESNLLKLKNAITLKFPGTRIAGMIAPPFLPAEQWNHQEYIDIINKARPDCIWVGLGAPKQEWWMYNQYKSIDKGILFGIGAGFDYLSGNTKHAPAWMKHFALEWLYRLLQEPKRLWKRYVKTIPPFLLLSLMELFGIRFNRNR